MVDEETSGNSSPNKVKNVDSDSTDADDVIDEYIKLTHRQIKEILHLPADHPGMILVTALLTGSNFLNWSKSIRRVLAARVQLKPDPRSKYYKRWLKVDYMVSTWINNYICKKLVNPFNYIDSSYKLWNALNQRFGGSNGPVNII